MEENKVMDYSNDLIFGKDKRENIVAIECYQDEFYLFYADGEITTEPASYWLLSNEPLDNRFKRLEGNQHYRYIRWFNDRSNFLKWRKHYSFKDIYSIYDPVQAYMVVSGTTLYKGMKLENTKKLTFDIEARNAIKNELSETLMISTTFKLNNDVIKKTFRVDHYNNENEMIEDWCSYVNECDPDIIGNHNILGYDLPYIEWCYNGRKFGNKKLPLGRCGMNMETESYEANYRVDGSQDWSYNNIKIFGRQVVDTMFTSVTYDQAKRNYPSWKLKEIIEYEGLIKEGRQFYDASQIGKDWDDLEKRELIVSYGEDDSDDAMALIELQLPQLFYYTQSIPRPLQAVVNTATGGQINSFLLRSYLQNGWAIPEADAKRDYGGGISFGNPGVYNNVNKVDVRSMYPSIIIANHIFNPRKDPKGHFLEMVKYFTAERLENKRIAKETGDKYYKGMEQAQKIVINSAYGLMGTGRLHFNSIGHADAITEEGRKILNKGIAWAEDNEFTIVNADTDSFSYTIGKKLKKEEFDIHIEEINNLMDDGIVWEDDGQYKVVAIIKAKNYALLGYGKKDKLIIKGSGLKATMKELALKEFTREVLELLVSGKKDQILNRYNEICSHIYSRNININRWTSKKTVTKAVLNPQRPTEQKLLTAIEGKNFNEGDKFWVYFKPDGSVKLAEFWTYDHCSERLYEKTYKTLNVFANVIDIDMIPNYKLKKNKDLLISIGECSCDTSETSSVF